MIPPGRRRARAWAGRPAWAPVSGRDDRGSILMLVPAGLLVVLIMASIAVDMALVQLRQRQAHDLAAGAANDAATAAVDQAALRVGRTEVDGDRARAVVDRVVAASDLAPQVVGTPVVTVSEAGRVEVEIALYADYVFAGVVPGTPDGVTVTATVSATAESPG